MCSISIAACFIFCNHSPLFYDNFGSEVWLNGFQSTFLDDSISVEHAREYGHTHLFEVYYLRYSKNVCSFQNVKY